MTQDEIICMANEAGEGFSDRDFNESWEFDQIGLERFANLVAEATKERCAGMIDNDDIHRGKWFAERIREMK